MPAPITGPKMITIEQETNERGDEIKMAPKKRNVWLLTFCLEAASHEGFREKSLPTNKVCSFVCLLCQLEL